MNDERTFSLLMVTALMLALAALVAAPAQAREVGVHGHTLLEYDDATVAAVTAVPQPAAGLAGERPAGADAVPTSDLFGSAAITGQGDGLVQIILPFGFSALAALGLAALATVALRARQRRTIVLP